MKDLDIVLVQPSVWLVHYSLIFSVNVYSLYFNIKSAFDLIKHQKFLAPIKWDSGVNHGDNKMCISLNNENQEMSNQDVHRRMLAIYPKDLNSRTLLDEIEPDGQWFSIQIIKAFQATNAE
jgi:hypothetical protein